MNTFLGESIKTTCGATITEVLNIDECVGKTIQTNSDFDTFAHKDGIVTQENFVNINIKGLPVKVVDIIRDSGLYLYCIVDNNLYFALSPQELVNFNELN